MTTARFRCVRVGAVPVPSTSPHLMPTAAPEVAQADAVAPETPMRRAGVLISSPLFPTLQWR